VRALARRLGAEIVLLHVTHVPEMVRAVQPGATVDEVVARERERAQTYLDGAARKIMESGAHGRSGWRALMLGSVARRVVLLATGRVLVMRPAEAQEPPR
jgi:nucleotide-binding universal stress UspA family protein